MIRNKPKKQKKQRIKNFAFRLNITEIKNKNLIFAVSYSEKGNTELYTDFLQYFEIGKPPENNIEIQKINIIYKNKVKKELPKMEAEKLILFLEFHNAKK